MAKRIQMRKNRFLAIQKMAEQKKNEALHASNANIHEATNMELANTTIMPKQTVSLFKNTCILKVCKFDQCYVYLCMSPSANKKKTIVFP
jgi:hypothetical protein